MNSRLFQITSWARKNRVALIVSLANTLVLSLLVYILNNQPVFTGENLNHFAWAEVFKNKIGFSDEVDKKDVLFVNVAYDKQFVKVEGQFGPVGELDITDRTKLLSFLRMLHATEKYKYIFLDVRFQKGYNLPKIDSLLFAEIGSMNNIVVAEHSDIETVNNTSLRKKTALSEYSHTIVATNFTKYKYSYGDRMSMPLYAYHELTGKSIKRCGLFYTCDGNLCYNSLFLNFPIESFEEYDESGHKNYYNLGVDLLENYSLNDIDTFTKDKYIVIGDMVEDNADTYSGKRPGPVILFYAFKSLMEGEHFVNYWVLLLMAVIYFAISLSQFNHESIMEKIPYVRKSHSKLLHFVLSFIGYAVILFLIVSVIDIFWGRSMSVLLPSIYFAIQKNIIHYKRMKI